MGCGCNKSKRTLILSVEQGGGGEPMLSATTLMDNTHTEGEMVLVGYTSKNLATHTVIARTRPVIGGFVKRDYGRHRGLTPEELQFLNQRNWEATVDELKEIGAFGRSVFYVHPDEINIVPGIFKVIREPIQATDPVERVDFTQFEHITERVNEELHNRGVHTIEDLKERGEEELADLLYANKTYTVEEKIEQILDGLD